MVVALATVPFLLSGLGIRAFGTYALLLTFSAVSGWFSLIDLGVWTATTRDLAAAASAEDSDATGNIVRASMAAVGLTGLVGAGLFGIFGPMVLPTVFRTPEPLVADLRFAIVIFAVTIGFDLVTGTAQACLEGFQRIDLSRAGDAIRRGVTGVATAVVAVGGGGLRGVAVAGLGAAVLGTVVTSVMLWPRVAPSGPRPVPLRRRMAVLYRSGRAVAVLRPLGLVERAMNRTIIGVVLGPAAVTLVELASQVQNGADAVLSASSYAVVPASSWLHAWSDHRQLRELVLRGTKYAVFATAAVSVLGIMLAGPMMRLWVGHVGSEAVGLARLGLLSTIMVAPIAVGSNLLLGTSRTNAILRAAAAAIVVNLGASLLLVHLIGSAGAFVGTLIANLVVVPMIVAAFLSATGIRVGEFVRSALLPSIVPVSAAALAVSAVLVGGWSDAVTVAVGAPVGLAVVVGMARWTLASPAELRELAGAFVRRTGGDRATPNSAVVA